MKMDKNKAMMMAKMMIKNKGKMMPKTTNGVKNMGLGGEVEETPVIPTGRVANITQLAPKGITNGMIDTTPTSSLGLAKPFTPSTVTSKIPGIAGLALQAGQMLSSAIPVDEYGVAKSGVGAYAKSALDPVGTLTNAFGTVLSDPGKANIGDYASMVGLGPLVAGLNNKSLAKKRDDQIAQQKIAANNAQFQSDVNTGATADANYLNGRGQGFNYNSQFDVPNGTRIDTPTDTTGFAKRSKDLLLGNVHQGEGGFIGNKRDDLNKYSPALLNTIGATGDGTPQGWMMKPTDKGFVMNTGNASVNLGTDKAFANYVSTLGVDEANKLKNPAAYEQAKLEFAKRVNIKPVENMAKMPNGGRIDAPQDMMKGQLITAPNGSTAPMHGQPGGDVPIQNAQGKTMVNAEPGEVLANLPDGNGAPVPTVLSKRLGYAQQFQQLTAEKGAITAKILSSKDRVLKAKLSIELRNINSQIAELGNQQDQENGNKSVDAQGQVSQDEPDQAGVAEGAEPKAALGDRLGGPILKINRLVDPNDPNRLNTLDENGRLVVNTMPTIGVNNVSPFATPLADRSNITPIDQFSNPSTDPNYINNARVVPNQIDLPGVTNVNRNMSLAPNTDMTVPPTVNHRTGIDLSGVGNFINKNQSGIEQGLAFAAPIVANIASQNAATKAYNKINDLQPKQFTNTPIDTRVDTSAAINTINQSVNQQIKGATQAFSDPTTGQSYAAKLTADKIPALSNIQTQANQQSASFKAMNAQASDRTSQMNVDQANKYDQMKAEAFGNLMGVKSSIGQASAQSLVNLIKEKNTNRAYDGLLRALYTSMDSSGGINLKHLPTEYQDAINGFVGTPNTKTNG
jgi:hypothetical protein